MEVNREWEEKEDERESELGSKRRREDGRKRRQEGRSEGGKL